MPADKRARNLFRSHGIDICESAKPTSFGRYSSRDEQESKVMKYIFNFKSFNKLTDINLDQLDSEKPSTVQSSAAWVACNQDLA